MAEMATYVGVTPRTIKVGASNLSRGFRVTLDSSNLAAVTDAATRGGFVTMIDGVVGENIEACSMSEGAKVPAYAGEASVDAGDLAYAFAGGKFGVTSTNAALLGRWTTTTAVNTLGEVELCSVA